MDTQESDFLNGIEHPKKRAVLAAYAESFNITKSCKAAGVGRTTHYGWISDDEDYANAFAEAGEIGAQSLEADAVRRAKEGLKRYKFHQGKPIMVACNSEHPEAKPIYKGETDVLPSGWYRHYYEEEFSDTLTIFLLKGAMPEKYRERYEFTSDEKELDAEIDRELEALSISRKVENG